MYDGAEYIESNLLDLECSSMRFERTNIQIFVALISWKSHTKDETEIAVLVHRTSLLVAERST